MNNFFRYWGWYSILRYGISLIFSYFRSLINLYIIKSFNKKIIIYSRKFGYTHTPYITFVKFKIDLFTQG